MSSATPNFLAKGSEGVPSIDPGSPLTIEGTLAKLRTITDLGAIRWLVCHHSDPDICAALPRLGEVLTHLDSQVVTEWRANALIRHYGHRFSTYLVEQDDWCLPLQGGRRLEFQLTAYLHFPGAMVSYDTSSHTLFSSDLFGGFVPDSSVMESADAAEIIENAQPLHQHSMPSRELLSAGLARIRSRWPRIEPIAPQHGHIVAAAIVDEVFSTLGAMDGGVYCLADADMDLKRLLRIAEARQRLNDVLVRQSSPVGMVRAIGNILESSGLANRRALDEAKLPLSYSLIELGLDHFKQVNDSFGHDAGDRVLKPLAQILRESVREQDQTFRLGGEEFLVLLPEADQATALLVAERIRLSVRRLDLAGVPPDGQITVSLGVRTKSAQLPSDFSRLMELADKALYSAKGDGRDQVCAADALSLSSR